MDEVQRENYQITPIKISEYIEENPPTTYVEVRTGAWNVANTSGYDFRASGRVQRSSGRL
ncbi:MAG: hypothetical protein OCU20_03240 [Methanophagales archaeon]|nr:hypothetical protein [Methanophagales archaeon]